MPVLLVVLGVTLYPTLDGVRLAFTDASLLRPDAVRYIGFENFTRLFGSEIFWLVLWHSLLLTVVAVALQFVLGLILAHLLATEIPGMQLFRSVAMVTWGAADHCHGGDVQIYGRRRLRVFQPALVSGWT